MRFCRADLSESARAGVPSTLPVPILERFGRDALAFKYIPTRRIGTQDLRGSSFLFRRSVAAASSVIGFHFDWSTFVAVLVTTYPGFETTVRISVPLLPTTRRRITGENGEPGMMISASPVQSRLTLYVPVAGVHSIGGNVPLKTTWSTWVRFPWPSK